MKLLLLMIISLPSFSADNNSPKELYYQLEKNKTETISIVLINDMKVNNECLKNKKMCLDILSVPVKSKLIEEKLSGNPASIFCFNKKGESIILRDNKFNEYDYCKFPGGMMVDSWDFFGKYKK